MFRKIIFTLPSMFLLASCKQDDAPATSNWQISIPLSASVVHPGETIDINILDAPKKSDGRPAEFTWQIEQPNGCGAGIVDPKKPDTKLEIPATCSSATIKLFAEFKELPSENAKPVSIEVKAEVVPDKKKDEDKLEDKHDAKLDVTKHEHGDNTPNDHDKQDRNDTDKGPLGNKPPKRLPSSTQPTEPPESKCKSWGCPDAG